MPLTEHPIIHDVTELEERLSVPTEGVVETLSRLEGDILILGIGGKMGPTLGKMAKRASEAAGVWRRVIGVSRFSSVGLEAELHAHGIETICCDLLDPDQLGRLPDAANVVYMAGMKFGTTGQEPLTWAMNTHVPGLICRKFRHSRIVAFSTGNVYPMVPVTGGGSLEIDSVGPLGEYAMSCVGRERIFTHYSSALGIPVALIRLSYAVELRYGVLVDIASRVFAGQPIDLTMGSLVAIWQGDANAQSLQAFDHVDSPPFVINITGPELLSVRQLANEFGFLLNRKVRFVGGDSWTGEETAASRRALTPSGSVRGLGTCPNGYPQIMGLPSGAGIVLRTRCRAPGPRATPRQRVHRVAAVSNQCSTGSGITVCLPAAASADTTS